jgi:hypothetical protein
LIRPEFLHTQTGQACPCEGGGSSRQRVEAAPAIAATVAGQSASVAPSLKLPASAMGAASKINLGLTDSR